MSLERIRQEMADRDFECVVLTEESNFVYALGVEAKGYLFITQDDIEIVCSKFFRYSLEEYDPEVACESGDYGKLLDEKAGKFSGRLAVDKKDERLEERFNFDEEGFLCELRRVKTEDEVDRHRRACEITDRAFEKLKPELFSGITEWKAVSKLNRFYCSERVSEAFLTNGGQSLVQANSLRPHREPKDDTIEEDDLVIVDTGARYGHRCADVTRTYCLNPSEKQRELFGDVKRIQEELLNVIQPGLEVSRLAERMMEMVSERGYDANKNVLYPPGHGVGIEVHEFPRLGRSSEAEFREGMVLAVEPGLHVPGVGGVRIEDTVIVTSSGFERLSKTPRKLVPE